MRRNHRGWAVMLLIAAAVAVFVWWLLRPKPVPAQDAVVTRGVLETAVEAQAKTRAHDPYVVASTVAGRLERIYLREGDTVNKGQLLASIDPLSADTRIRRLSAQLAEVRAQRAGVESARVKEESLAQARARDAQAQAAHAQAIRDLRRAQALAASGDIAQTQLEDARLVERTRAQELAAANAALAELRAKRSDPDYLFGVYDAQARALRAELQTLEDQRSRTQIRAPASGTVLRVLQRSETAVSEGTPLIELADLRDLEIVADVLSEDAVGIHPGDAMVVERGAGAAPIQARVTSVEPSAETKVSALGVEEQRVNVVGKFASVPAALGDNFRLDVRIVTWRAAVLRVPSGALFRCGDLWCVYKVVNGRARTARVGVGHRSADAAEVRAGLRAGDRVVLHPSDRVADGTALDFSAP